MNDTIDTPKPLCVLLCLPTGSGCMETNTHFSLEHHGWPPGHRVAEMTVHTTALPHTFNKLWCEALNGRSSHGVTHFAMLHDDTWVEDGWLGKLLEIMHRREEPLVSVTSPIKTEDGLTCTALDTDPWDPRRLSMKELMKMPPTFGSDDVTPENLKLWGVRQNPRGSLLVGAGAWLADIRPREIPGVGLVDWSASVCFRFDTAIESVDGEFTPRFANESWEMCRDLVMMGVPVCNTREVRLRHFGKTTFNNWDPWGTRTTDEKGK